MIVFLNRKSYDLFRMSKEEYEFYQEAQKNAKKSEESKPADKKDDKKETKETDNRTIDLIDNFLSTLPKDEPKEEKAKRHPTPADATVDYVAYLMECESYADETEEVPQLKGQDLIDSFIEYDTGKIVLSETPVFTPDIKENNDNDQKDGEEGRPHR